jgi:hypothetical protein
MCAHFPCSFPYPSFLPFPLHLLLSHFLSTFPSLPLILSLPHFLPRFVHFLSLPFLLSLPSPRGAGKGSKKIMAGSGKRRRRREIRGKS